MLYIFNYDIIFNMLHRNFLLIVSGPMGGGKSTLSKGLHKVLPRTILIEPDYIKYTISDYKNTSSRYSNDILNIIINNCEYFLSKNFNVIVDNSIQQDKYIKLLRNLTSKTNSLFYIIQVEASIKTCLSRVIKRKIHKSINKVPLFKIKYRIKSYLTKKKSADFLFNSERENINEMIEKILGYINKIK